MRQLRIGASTVGLTLIFALIHGCGERPKAARVSVDGSSTVAPILNSAAESFGKLHAEIRLSVGVSGTGGGFKKFLETSAELRTDINDASRPISETELARTKELKIEFVELPIAMDGMAVVVNPGNRFCDYLTVDELRRIWAPDSKIKNWSEVREGFPDLALRLYGPGTDSGTFDYFTEAIVGKAKSSRSDYNASENDNVLVTGVAEDAGGLGYFGFSYADQNRNRLKILAIDSGSGEKVKPDRETIHGGRYRPLARPLFVYVNKQSLSRPEVRTFVDYLVDNAREIVERPSVDYIALDPAIYAVAKKRLADSVTGTLFAEKGAMMKPLAEIYGVAK
ncbi:MAG: PstS family phosphate ABC transporter substrate-binding protein [Phycisphaerae bacterium]